MAKSNRMQKLERISQWLALMKTHTFEILEEVWQNFKAQERQNIKKKNTLTMA